MLVKPTLTVRVGSNHLHNSEIDVGPTCAGI